MKMILKIKLSTKMNIYQQGTKNKMNDIIKLTSKMEKPSNTKNMQIGDQLKMNENKCIQFFSHFFSVATFSHRRSDLIKNLI